ncbi:hypothetical protein O4G98_06865 [Zoogloeaceae bacterium G21618-S1]|nr:hypothetical protein [Zoogloeaceae bacterium G21618-S1]
MDKIELRRFSKLGYRAPAPFLVELRRIEIELALSQTPKAIRHLRTNGLKSLRELREAAIFCHMMSERIGTIVFLSPIEEADYDFVSLHVLDGTTHYSKIQLKELTSTDCSGSRTLESLISSLSKYGSAPELCVAVHLNRRLKIDPLEVAITQEAKGIGSLWMFGAIAEDQSRWGLWGNLLERSSIGTSHIYPR